MAEHHIHLIVTGYVNKNFEQSSLGFIEDWFRELVTAIDMNILVEPKAVWCDTPGNEGATGAVIIDTSHSSWHQWNGDEPYFKFDLYSCKEYDVEVVLDLLRKIGTYEVEYMVIDRENRKMRTLVPVTQRFL